jgi:hypothetical protein
MKYAVLKTGNHYARMNYAYQPCCNTGLVEIDESIPTDDYGNPITVADYKLVDDLALATVFPKKLAKRLVRADLFLEVMTVQRVMFV